jgi:hypothetical protein
MTPGWVNDGACVDDDGSRWVIEWRPADGGPARVTSRYCAVRNRNEPGRHRALTFGVRSVTVYRNGEWSHQDIQLRGSYATRREAVAWARRDAEAEARGFPGVCWDGRPSPLSEPAVSAGTS